MQLDAKYATDIIEFINKIICYSILKKKSNVIGNKVLLILNNKSDQKFMLKLE